MKNSYDEIEDLLSDLEYDIESTLLDDVLEEVKQIELRHVKDDVFSVYHPKIYKRREFGGIDDPDNITGYVENMQLSVENITPFNDDYGSSNHGIGLTDLINDGEKRHSYFYDYPGEFTMARPFWDNTVEEIEHTEHVEEALKKGLKKHGWDIK